MLKNKCFYSPIYFRNQILTKEKALQDELEGLVLGYCKSYAFAM